MTETQPAQSCSIVRLSSEHARDALVAAFDEFSSELKHMAPTKKMREAITLNPRAEATLWLNPAEATDSELVEKLQAYWAFSKRDKRVAGLIGWHWSTLYPTFAAGMRLGAREFPLTKQLVAEIVGCLQ